jgi:acetyl esterase/lipase
MTKPPIDDILQKVLEAVPFKLSVDEGVHEARRRLRDLPRRPLHPAMRVEDHRIDGPSGPIPVRVYWPDNDHDVHPVTMFFHGGGFALGDLDTHDVTAREHAAGADTVVVSVDYRLAPEHPFPAAVEDVWAATCWVAQNGGQFGADGTRLAVAGDSAGGTLSAVVAQLARDHARSGADGPTVAFQLLWYPSTMWDTSLPSFTENSEAPVLDHAALAAFTQWYAGHLGTTAEPPTQLAPGRAADLTGLPPAYIAVAGHDPLRDDGVRYAELLAAAGVPVELDNAETLVHGYLGYSGVVPAATAATERGLAALRAALHP